MKITFKKNLIKFNFKKNLNKEYDCFNRNMFIM